MTCCVCLESTSNALLPCMHYVCVKCATICVQTCILCPMCRQVIVQYKPSIEVNSDSVIVEFACACEMHAGIELISLSNGVGIKKLCTNDQAYKHGLRVGQKITHINNIPIRAHEDGTRIFNTAAYHKMSTCCDVHKVVPIFHGSLFAIFAYAQKRRRA